MARSKDKLIYKKINKKNNLLHKLQKERKRGKNEF